MPGSTGKSVKKKAACYGKATSEINRGKAVAKVNKQKMATHKSPKVETRIRKKHKLDAKQSNQTAKNMAKRGRRSITPEAEDAEPEVTNISVNERATRSKSPVQVEFQEGDQLVEMTTENCDESYFESDSDNQDSDRDVSFKNSQSQNRSQ